LRIVTSFLIANNLFRFLLLSLAHTTTRRETAIKLDHEEEEGESRYRIREIEDRKLATARIKYRRWREHLFHAKIAQTGDILVCIQTSSISISLPRAHPIPARDPSPAASHPIPQKTRNQTASTSPISISFSSHLVRLIRSSSQFSPCREARTRQRLCSSDFRLDI
jgi:hypothetical protein